MAVVNLYRYFLAFLVCEFESLGVGLSDGF